MRQQNTLDHMAPRLSLPQRSILMPTTQANALADHSTKILRSSWPKETLEDNSEADEGTPAHVARRSSAQALVKQPLLVPLAPTSAPDVPAAPSPADLQLIPATGPLPSVGSDGRHARAFKPRLTIQKLVIFGTVLFAVLAATLTTAGGGPVVNLFWTAFHASAPSTSAASLAGGSIAERVHPIIQAHTDAGYDSPAQHDTWWDSVCSAAAFTEVARAWGISNVTIGQVLDRLLAHNPSYITVSGGLMSQDGWGWMAQAYHLQAQVAWHTFTFDSLVHQVVTTGIPIIIGMDGGNPNYPWGHFVVITGGDSTQVQIVDSSLWQMQTLPRSFFTGPTSGIINEPIWWTGETVILTPI
ncbi:MAG TPA: C39 family peptidase [Ktedonobacterales bacterium]|nr:C39 family peptidase [Ktedonobacterales bacterium]